MVGPERRGQHTGVTMFKIFFVAHQRTALYTHVYTYVIFRGSLRNALKTTPFYLSARQKKKLQFVSFFSLDSSILFSFYFPCHPSRGNVDSRCSSNITCTYPILTNTHRKHVFASTIHSSLCLPCLILAKIKILNSTNCHSLLRESLETKVIRKSRNIWHV